MQARPTARPLAQSRPAHYPQTVAGYALELHDCFWSSITKKRRVEYVGIFVARAKQQGMGNPELAKDLVRALGAEVKDFGAAAAILAGFEAYSWTTFHWARPASHFAPN